MREEVFARPSEATLGRDKNIPTLKGLHTNNRSVTMKARCDTRVIDLHRYSESPKAIWTWRVLGRKGNEACS